jgi:ATP-dependent DNA ligase
MRRAAALKESDMNTFVARSRRPKKMSSLEELEKKLLFGSRRTLRENGKERQISVIEAVYRVEIAKALKGDQRAIEFLIKRGEAIATAEAAKEEGRDRATEGAEVLLQMIRETFAVEPHAEEKRSGDATSQLGPP